MEPDSQGMRKFSSTNCATQLHNFMLIMGRFGRLTSVSVEAGDCHCSCVLMDDFSLTTDLEGRERDATNVRNIARIAVDARKA